MINRKTFLAIGLLFLFPLDLPAQLPDSILESWRNIKDSYDIDIVVGEEVLEGWLPVRVFVDINDDGQRLVSSGQIETDVELTLRRNGIRVYSEDLLFPPWLHLSIIALENLEEGTGRPLGFTASILIELRERVLLDRDSPKWNRGSIWDRARLNTFRNRSSGAQGIRRVVRDLVDQFSNDYLAMNPITR